MCFVFFVPTVHFPNLPTKAQEPEDILNTSLGLPGAFPQTFSRFSTSDGRVGLFFKQFSRADNFGIGNHNRRQATYPGELSKGYEGIDGKPQSFAETQGDFAISYTISETP